MKRCQMLVKFDDSKAVPVPCHFVVHPPDEEPTVAHLIKWVLSSIGYPGMLGVRRDASLQLFKSDGETLIPDDFKLDDFEDSDLGTYKEPLILKLKPFPNPIKMLSEWFRSGGEPTYMPIGNASKYTPRNAESFENASQIVSSLPAGERLSKELPGGLNSDVRQR